MVAQVRSPMLLLGLVSTFHEGVVQTMSPPPPPQMHGLSLECSKTTVTF